MIKIITARKRLQGLFFLGVMVLIAGIQSCVFSGKACKRLFRESENKQYDIIVVPGVPLNNGMWDSTMKARVYWSKYLYDKGIAKNIMYSGSSVYSPYYEGMVMALYAEAIGIPKENIYTEIKAEHSTENIYYSYKKAKNIGFEKIALASDPWQTKQLRRFTRKKISPDVGMIPFVTDSLKTMWPIMRDTVVDYQQTINKDFISIKKRESLWKRLRGTMGKNIDTTYYR